jgi:hypothetical protein
MYIKLYFKRNIALFLALVGSFICLSGQVKSDFKHFSGIYPHLAYYNNEGECGTGAVVPWADQLWVITYGPHLPYGSSDKLYEITPDLRITTRQESIGGTPANRMIHKESNQLFIGPYAIDKNRLVRSISYAQAPGRYTGLARHLTDPTNQLLLATMEEGFYQLNVNTLNTNILYIDGNVKMKKQTDSVFHTYANLPGAHGKGLYSGQGVMVFSNNGEANELALKKFDIEAGSLSEWNGKNWSLVRRNQFVEVTGPGGIYGNANPEKDPIWATGWDHKSVLLGVRHDGKWTFYRLPKSSHSYDGAHGWNTEWPRIRDIGTEAKPYYLMTMHGLFWEFPGNFTPQNSKGIRPLSAYLKVIGDFTRWQGGLVFGCDDSAQKEFLNTRRTKGNIVGPGQSNSNLWFTSLATPLLLGPNTAQGSVWTSENVAANDSSEPFLLAGWKKRIAWIKNEGNKDVNFTFETDIMGNNKWKKIKSIEVKAGSTKLISFEPNLKGEWIRVTTDKDTKATVHFNYTDDSRFVDHYDKIFEGLANIENKDYSGGLLYGLGTNRRKLGVLAGNFLHGKYSETGYYELDSAMNLTLSHDNAMTEFMHSKISIPKEVMTVDDASVLIIDDANRRWRLPKSHTNFSEKVGNGDMRICREVATERDLLNAYGTFYELPAENADGFAKIRPVCSHSFAIHDYASYRGLLIMTGLDRNHQPNEHIITSSDKKAKIWAGTIDDLWKLGKPKGQGGPLKDSQIMANTPSDPYLIGYYDKKELKISHSSAQPVSFKIEVDPSGHGPWMTYREVIVQPNSTFKHSFPSDFQARWIRFSTDKDCKATTWLEYK